MEVPRYWRDMKTNTSFSGREIGSFGVEPANFKYPGGEISLAGSYEEIRSRFEEKGFNLEAVDEILFDLFGAIASEAAISFEKVINGHDELVGTEVGEKNWSEIKLRVNRLPGKVA